MLERALARTLIALLLAILPADFAATASAATTSPGPIRGATPSIGFSGDPVDQMVAAEEQLNYTGILDFGEDARARIVHAAGGRQRIEYLDPPPLRGELVIYNGRTRWHYSPRTNRIDLSPSDGGEQDRRVRDRLIHQNYREALGPQAVLASRPVEEMDLVPRHRDGGLQKVWLDLATGLPLKMIRYSSFGQEIEHSEFQSIQFLSSAPERAFDFSLPNQAKVSTPVIQVAHGTNLTQVRGFVTFPVSLPRYLPPGFQVMDVRVFDAQHVRTLHWRLTDGLDTLSLFVTAARHHAPAPRGARRVQLGNDEGFMLSEGPSKLLSWSTSTTSYTLIGQLPAAELIKIALSSLPRR